MLEADNEFRQAAGLPQLDLPEHLWTVRNMDTAPVREQHFTVISSEVEVLRQQLKGKGVYPAPPSYTQNNQQNVHFQPIHPAKLSPLQPQDRLFFNPLLSTTTGSTGSQSDSTHNATQHCSSAPPMVHTPSPRIPEPTIPPTPYVNQTAVEQHMRTQSPSVPPRNIATVAPPPRESPQASSAQETLITLATSQTTPPQAQNQLTTSPQRSKRSKSKDGRGIKQSKNVNATDIAQVCWRPPGSTSPLSTPPPPPTTATTEVERQNIIKYCKKNILPDPAANCFAKVDEKAPTRVLAAAIYCTLERKYFDDKTPRAQVAMMFQVTTAQLTKAVTRVDYMSGPHTYIKKRKTSAEPSTSTATQTPKPTAAKTTSATALKAPHEAEDTLSSSSSSDLPPL